jgi:hypothetical protein
MKGLMFGGLSAMMMAIATSSIIALHLLAQGLPVAIPTHQHHW